MGMTYDELFQKLLMNFFVEFIELFFPELARHLDRESLTFSPQTYYIDFQRDQIHNHDVLAQAKVQGQETCFLIHVERQPYNPEDFNRWMFGYFLELSDKILLPIYPIALFSCTVPFALQNQPHKVSPQSQPYEVNFQDFKVIEFNFAPVHLHSLHWRDFLHQQNPIAVALLPTMQVAPQDRLTVKAECLRRLPTLQLSAARKALVSEFVNASLKLNAMEEGISQTGFNRTGIIDRE
jgi:hypothetical protein